MILYDIRDIFVLIYNISNIPILIDTLAALSTHVVHAFVCLRCIRLHACELRDVTHPAV